MECLVSPPTPQLWETALEAYLPLQPSPPAVVGLGIQAIAEFTLEGGKTATIPVGIGIQTHPGTYGQLAARSSLVVQGINVLGGVIDPDYQGELYCITLF